MNLDQTIEAWRNSVGEAKWDTVTERRVLTKLLSYRRESRSTVSRPRLVAVAAMAAAVLAILGLAIFMFDNGTHPTMSKEAEPDIAGAGAEHGSGAGLSQLRFLDGSTATYLTVAEVDVEEQSISAVRIWHKSGQVRYQAKKIPTREFTVNAGGIEVKVVGTVFVVEVDVTDVRVKVERGMVIVDSGSGVVELTAGEEIVLAARDRSSEQSVAMAKEEPEAPLLTGTIAVADGTPKRYDESAPSFSCLMREVDRARKRGDNNLAAKLLLKLVVLYPGDGRIVSVLYTLGKVESQRGRYVDAARAFHKCWRSSPGGTLAEDAHFQEAISLDRIGHLREANKAAKRYLDKFPDGPYAGRMRKITQ